MTVMCYICQEWFEMDDDEFFEAIEESCDNNVVDEMICPECAKKALEFWNMMKQN